MADANKLLNTLLESIAIEQRYDNCQIIIRENDEDAGYFTSKLFKAIIKSPNKEDLKLFAKVPVFSKEFQDVAFSSLYCTEKKFYTDIARTFERIQDEYNIRGHDRVIFPKFYGCITKHKEETFVLEDLSATGFACFNRFEVVDWKFICKAIEELAKFHALSLAYKEIDPDGCSRMFEKMKYIQFAETEVLEGIFKNFIDVAVEASDEEYREKLTEFMKVHGYATVDSPYYNPVLKPVVRHGDYKLTNLMYKDCEDGNMFLTIVDYQTLHVGCGVVDLMTLIFTSTDGMFRKKHYRQLLEHYFQELRSMVARFGLEPDEVYSREDFDCELKAVLPYGLASAVIFLPPCLMEAADVPNFGAAESAANIVFRPSRGFKERLDEVLREYSEWGLL